MAIPSWMWCTFHGSLLHSTPDLIKSLTSVHDQITGSICANWPPMTSNLNWREFGSSNDAIGLAGCILNMNQIFYRSSLSINNRSVSQWVFFLSLLLPRLPSSSSSFLPLLFPFSFISWDNVSEYWTGSLSSSSSSSSSPSSFSSFSSSSSCVWFPPCFYQVHVWESPSCFCCAVWMLDWIFCFRKMRR